MKEARSLADRLQGGNKYTKADRDKQAQMIRTEGGGEPDAMDEQEPPKQVRRITTAAIS